MKSISRLMTGIALAGALNITCALAQENPKRSEAEGWRSGGGYSRMYNPQTVETIRGKVVKVETVTPGRGMGRGVHLLVRTDSKTIPVHLGPSWFIENQPTQIEANDDIEITGSRVSFNGQSTLIAREVRKDGNVLRLRDENGRPVWAAWSSEGRPGGMGGPMGPGGMEHRKKMMEAHQEWINRLQSMNADLEKKLGIMHEAKGDAKVKEMENVINELVAQREEIVNHMATMHKRMMTHMKQMQGMGRPEKGMGAPGESSETESESEEK